MTAEERAIYNQCCIAQSLINEGANLFMKADMPTEVQAKALCSLRDFIVESASNYPEILNQGYNFWVVDDPAPAPGTDTAHDTEEFNDNMIEVIHEREIGDMRLVGVRVGKVLAERISRNSFELSNLIVPLAETFSNDNMDDIIKEIHAYTATQRVMKILDISEDEAHKVIRLLLANYNQMFN